MNTVSISSSPTYMMSVILLSMVAVMLCVESIIIKHFFNVCKILTIYRDIYDMLQHFQNCLRASNNWMAGRSLDNLVLEVYICMPSGNPSLLWEFFNRKVLPYT